MNSNPRARPKMGFPAGFQSFYLSGTAYKASGTGIPSRIFHENPFLRQITLNNRIENKEIRQAEAVLWMSEIEVC